MQVQYMAVIKINNDNKYKISMPPVCLPYPSQRQIIKT